MKPDLLIISDLWGLNNADWLDFYLKELASVFNVICYDVRELGELQNYANADETEIHAKFLEYGIDNAVKNLLKLKAKKLNILAFSIGGTISWKAALHGLEVNSLFLISATRLRYETQKPSCNFYLLYGNKDEYKPSSEWFIKMNIESNMVESATHTFYTEKAQIDKIVQKIKSKLLQ